MAIRMLALLFAAALWVLPQAVFAAEVFDGTVVQANEGELVLQVGDEEKSFTLNDQTSITLDGVMAEAAEVTAGITASVTAEKQNDDSWLATVIVAQTSPVVGDDSQQP